MQMVQKLSHLYRRTEFLSYGFSRFPTEDEQHTYKAVLEGMNGKPVVVRTMDIGGDMNSY